MKQKPCNNETTTYETLKARKYYSEKLAHSTGYKVNAFLFLK